MLAKNVAHTMMLNARTVASRKAFRWHQRIVKRTVNRAREEWIVRVAREGEAAVKDGKARWESIRKLQQVHAGRRAARPTSVRKEDGGLAQGPVEILDRWHQHFSKLLNQQSEYSLRGCD